MKHTQGPWFSVAPKYLGHIWINSDHGVICRIKNEVSKKPLTQEDEANAKLIAAAPLMYQALLNIKNCQESDLAEYCKLVDEIACSVLAEME